jgi:LmbE family N-acetylglucosaminyl deacetylase
MKEICSGGFHGTESLTAGGRRERLSAFVDGIYRDERGVDWPCVAGVPARLPRHILQASAVSRRLNPDRCPRTLTAHRHPNAHYMSTAQITETADFNPSLPGTPETTWRKALTAKPAWAPRRGPLLVVSPHPDDEVLGAGGLMRMWSAWHLPMMLLSVTDGEAAYPGWQDLKERRRAELDCALGVLSPAPIPTVRLGLSDGGGESNKPELYRALAALCDRRPTLIGPYEHDGHPDHEATGEACLQIAKEFQLPIARYPIWAWHHGRPRDFEGARVGRFALDTVTQAAKADAIDRFTSQLAPGGSRIPIVPAHVLDYFKRDFEAFVL